MEAKKQFKNFLDYLSTLPERIVLDEQKYDITNRLSEIWNLLDGSNENAMQADKLNRIFDCIRENSILYFKIERHGGTVLGSVYAEIHEWKVDALAKRAEIISVRKKQLSKKRPSLTTKEMNKIVDSISGNILKNKNSPNLKWGNDRKQVTVLIGQIIPSGGPQQTITSRRKRFAKLLQEKLGNRGWKKNISSNKHVFEKVIP